MFKRIRIVFALAFLVVISANAWSVELDASAGLGGRHRDGSWLPVSISLKNPDRDSFSGTIAAFNTFDKQASCFQTPFELPGPSEKHYTYYCLYNYPMTSTGLTLKMLLTRGSAPDNDLLAQCGAATVSPTDALVVAVGSNQATLNFLSGIKLNQANSKLGTPECTLQVGLASPASIPDRPLGYDSADMIVLADFRPDQADPKQLAALKMWVSSGGTLVINGGPDYQRLQNEFYKDLLPISVTGVKQIGDLSAMQAKYGSTLASGAASVTVGTLKSDSSVILEQNGIPLISHRVYGNGEVFFLAPDYTSFPLKGWDGQQNMWKSILLDSRPCNPMASPADFEEPLGGPTAPPAAVPGAPPVVPANTPEYGLKAHGNPFSTDPGNNIFESIASNVPAVAAPSAAIIFSFLIAYLVCLVPINYFILTRKKRRELAWITTPAIILLFTFGAYGIGYAMRGGKLLLKTVTIVESGLNSQYASVTTYGGIFSPSRRSYDLRIDDPYAVVSETPQSSNGSYANKTDRNLQVRLGEITELPKIQMDMWAMRTFRVESGCDLTGTIAANLNMNGVHEIAGTITNNTNFDLKHCLLIKGSGCSLIPNIRQKSTIKINANLAVKTTDPGGWIKPDDSQSPLDKMKADITQSVISRSGQIESSPDQMILIAWSDRPPASTDLFRGRGERQAANCFVFWLGEPGGPTK